MILADYGASVIRVDKIGAGLNYDVTSRGKKSISLNLKKPEGAQILKKLYNKHYLKCEFVYWLPFFS